MPVAPRPVTAQWFATFMRSSARARRGMVRRLLGRGGGDPNNWLRSRLGAALLQNSWGDLNRLIDERIASELRQTNYRQHVARFRGYCEKSGAEWAEPASSVVREIGGVPMVARADIGLLVAGEVAQVRLMFGESQPDGLLVNDTLSLTKLIAHEQWPDNWRPSTLHLASQELYQALPLSRGFVRDVTRAAKQFQTLLERELRAIERREAADRRRAEREEERRQAAAKRSGGQVKAGDEVEERRAA